MSNAYPDDDDIDNMDFLPDSMPPEATVEDDEDDGSHGFLREPTASAPSFRRPMDPADAPLIDARSFAAGGNDSGLSAAQQADLKRQMKRFLIIYPAYFDAKRSVANGRRVPAKLAYEEPTVWHIAKALERIGFPGVIEAHKTHPADPFNRGRARTFLQEDGIYVHPTVRTRKQLILKLAALFPEVQADVDELMAEQKRRDEQQMQAMQAQLAAMGMPPGMMQGLPGMGGGGGGFPGLGGLLPGMGGGGGAGGLPPGLAGLLGGAGGMPGMPGMGMPTPPAAAAPTKPAAGKKKAIVKKVVRK